MNLRFIIFLLILFSSCRSELALRKKFGEELNSKFEPINSEFEVRADSSNYFSSTGWYIINNYRDSNYREVAGWKNYSMHIKTEATSLTINLIKDDSVLQSKKYNGKQKENYFKIKRQKKLWGIPPLFWSYYESLILLKTDANGNLIIANSWISWGSMLFFVAGDNHSTTFSFKKIR